MGECTKELTDAVAMPSATGVTRRAVGRSNAQRGARIGEMLEFGVLAQAREHAPPGIGDDEFERAVASTVGDQPGGRPAAVFKDIILQLTERAHQAGSQAFGETSGHGGVLGVLGPLIPKRVVSADGWIEQAQGEDAGAVAGAGAADRAVGQRVFYLVKDRRLDRHAAIGVGRRQAGDRKFDQGTDEAGTTEDQRRQLRQAAGNGLPQQVVGRLKGWADAVLIPHAQWRSSPSPTGKALESDPEPSNKSAILGCGFDRAIVKAHDFSTLFPVPKGYSLAS